ncbi:penicillin-binding protein [Jiella sp. MQZ9-1]|uniref:peptidoglycan glycosyltransferase n=1 Tax=Jiella flava TaxID=2816857 RepID=A0A939G0T6_9HYPH|nr:transglycosylase domain-containing protein [Jiella flava]MBO0663716.1 penicillin-binding protein [Jiella flava]MCD2472290.1 penicillin-binding protein [Jiella flava]
MMTGERKSRIKLVALVVLLVLAGATTSLVVWVDAVAARYGATVATTRERVRSNRLIVDLPEHGAKPWDAPIEEMVYLRYDQVPKIMRQAILRSEDSWFFYHPGFNPVAIGKAILSQFGTDPRGGSTITQQIAKQLYVGSQRVFARKFDELAIAIWLEWHFSKRELLEFYFNIPFMGHNTKGLEAAARYYFGYSFKDPSTRETGFTPDMAASLAVTIKNPTGGNPTKPRNLWEARRLLLQMRLKPVVLTAQTAADPNFSRRFAAHAFSNANRLSDRFGSARDLAIATLTRKLGTQPISLDVVTDYSSEVQLDLETAIADQYPPIEQAGYDRLTAMVVNNRTGGIEGIVATPGATIYPGSTVKPLLTLCALVDHGWGAQTTVLDTPLGQPPVRNEDGRYLGRTPLETALAMSRNPPFVRMMETFGAPCANNVLARMGATFRFQGAPSRSMALGAAPVDAAALLNAYVTIASCGAVSNAPLIIKEARDRRTQKVVMRQKARPLAEDNALRYGLDVLQTMLLKTTGPEGTASGSRFIPDIAAKTGTSDGNRQITLITFTRAYTLLVSAEASDLMKLDPPLTSQALVPLVREVNTKIHDGKDPGPLGCKNPATAVSP